MAFLAVALCWIWLVQVQGQQPDHANLDCADSGYCSLGISKFWTGDISTGPKLREMLEAVSFKKELIITSLTAGGPNNPDYRKWADLVVQMSWELETLGFGHFLVVGTTRSACESLHQIVPHISCVWDETPMPLWGGGGPEASRLAWYFRWKLFARCGRLGYNLMNVDADFVFFRDPYKFLKTGLMSQIKMWCNPEGGGPLHCNGGFTYIQDLKPDGPVSWVFKNLVDEQMWMMDDNYQFIESTGGSRHCHNFDQEMVFDGVKSAFVGRPLVLDSLNECRGSKWRVKNRFGVEIGRAEMMTNTQKLIDFDKIKDERQVPLPEGWVHPDYPVDTDFTRILVNRLTVPNMKYGWPTELGGPLGMVPRGPYSAAWIACLKDDCPDCPWWVEERPFKAGRDELDVALGPKLDGKGGKFVSEMFWDDTVPVELLGVGPAWLSNSLLGFRNGMFAGRAARLPANFAMSHLHFWPDLAGGHKTMVRKVVGRFNWTLSALQQAPGQAPYACKHPVSRVLALHPSIDLRRTRSMAEFNTIVLGLIQVAHLMHRTPVLPDVPCEAPWLHAGHTHGTDACKAPLNTGGERYRYPSNLPYPVDDAGQMVGGWVRRLQETAQHVLMGQTASADGTQSEAPVGILYATDSEGVNPELEQPQRQQSEGDQQEQQLHTDGPRGQRQKQPGGQGQGGSQQQAGRGLGVSEAAGQPQQWWRRALRGAYMTPKEQGTFWANQKRFMYSMGYMWEQNCMEHVGKPYAMLRSELAYFMTQPPAQGRASLRPTETNTILLPDDSLKQQPLQSDPGPGVVLRPDMQRGWSVADGQVLAPVGQLLMAAGRHSEEPLLYLGHPVALVPSTVRHARGDTHDHGQSTLRAHTGGEGEGPGRQLLDGRNVMLTVDELDKTLSDINRRVQNSGCGLLKTAHEGGTKLTLDYPQARLALVKGGMLSALTPGLVKRSE